MNDGIKDGIIMLIIDLKWKKSGFLNKKIAMIED